MFYDSFINLDILSEMTTWLYLCNVGTGYTLKLLQKSDIGKDSTSTTQPGGNAQMYYNVLGMFQVIGCVH